jgi:hypothetical protein
MVHYLTARTDRAWRMTTIAAASAVDAIARPKPSSLDRVPGSASLISAAWLSAALCANTPGGRVLQVEVVPVSDGSTSRSRLQVTYNEAGRVASLPQSVFVKSSTNFSSRLVVGMTGAAEGEARFYARIRPTIDIRAPHGYYGATERRTGRTIILLENIADSIGATFGDCTNRYVDREMAQSLVDNLAKVHGSLWNSPRFTSDLRWLHTSEDVQNSVNHLIDFEGRSLVGVNRAGDVLPAEITRQRSGLMAAFMHSLTKDSVREVGLVHTDVHSGNWYVTPDGAMGLYDWQALAKGQGFRDLAYALMSNLTIADRREWERELVMRYLDAFREAGGAAIDEADAWLRYRQQTWHGLFYWLYTIGAGRMQPSMQKTSVSLVNLERMGQAVADLESMKALDE